MRKARFAKAMRENAQMREDLGRMAQHFENLKADPTKPRLRCLIAGAAAGALGITVVPWLAAVIISWGW